MILNLFECNVNTRKQEQNLVNDHRWSHKNENDTSSSNQQTIEQGSHAVLLMMTTMKAMIVHEMMNYEERYPFKWWGVR